MFDYEQISTFLTGTVIGATIGAILKDFLNFVLKSGFLLIWQIIKWPFSKIKKLPSEELELENKSNWQSFDGFFSARGVFKYEDGKILFWCGYLPIIINKQLIRADEKVEIAEIKKNKSKSMVCGFQNGSKKVKVRFFIV